MLQYALAQPPMAYYEFTITMPDAFLGALVQRLTDLGCLGFLEKEDILVAYFPDSADIKPVFHELEVSQALMEKSGQGQNLVFRHALIPDQDWNESWKKGFTPIDVGARFTILPPWEQPHKNRVNLIIDPGMAFGTGHHETTRSCLVLMEKYFGKTGKDNFLDLGTGTGLLAIAASKLGYKKVIAVDTDPLATEAALMNLRINGVQNVEVKEGSIDSVLG